MWNLRKHASKHFPQFSSFIFSCYMFKAALNTFDSNDVQGRKQKSIPRGTEASWDVFSSDTGQGRQSGLKPD